MKGVVIGFKDGKPFIDVESTERINKGKDTVAKAYINEEGRLVVGVLKVYDGCVTCPYSEEHPIGTPDPFEHCQGVYCSLLKDEHPYLGAETDKRKVFEYDSPSEKRQFENYIAEWCPFRKNPI